MLMENLLSGRETKLVGKKHRGNMLTAERAIHVLVFVLLLLGLCVISAWASYNYISDQILKVATIPLVWGVILLILYLGFKKLGWDWWS